jgi:aerobic-type carbon monoxide dehydrogenase small subunit (CoxS/CutS family)
MTHTISLTINGQADSREVEPRHPLIHHLREVLGCTGPGIGCGTSAYSVNAVPSAARADA